MDHDHLSQSLICYQDTQVRLCRLVQYVERRRNHQADAFSASLKLGEIMKFKMLVIPVIGFSLAWTVWGGRL
jgi:hypothetical protein